MYLLADKDNNSNNFLFLDGEVRGGFISDENKNISTLAIGGNLGVTTKKYKNTSARFVLYTTNHLLGKNENELFLNQDNQNYYIIGEAYIESKLFNTTLKVGRQQVDTPYIDSDDVGMIPNRFEGLTSINRSIDDVALMLFYLNRWSGMGAVIKDRFTSIQDDGEYILAVAVIYEKLHNTTLEAWHYKMSDEDYLYLLTKYENHNSKLEIQYTKQGDKKIAYGANARFDFGNFDLRFAYNVVDGVVSDGFGGGPFFTSVEAHTIADIVNQEALLISGEYEIDLFDFSITNVWFLDGENQTDYLSAYKYNDNIDSYLIYSDRYKDGTTLKFVSSYKF
jgi:hypothetical protein